MALSSSELYDFKNFRLDVGERLLLRNGVPIPLAEKAFETLCVLVRKAGHLVTKDELLAEVWPNTVVEENNLDKNISLLRRVLDERRGKQKYIETVRGRGYRFVETVSRVKIEVPTSEENVTRSLTPSRLFSGSVRSVGHASARLAPVISLSDWRHEVAAGLEKADEPIFPPAEIKAHPWSARGYLVVAMAVVAFTGLSLLAIYSLVDQKGAASAPIESIAVLPFNNAGSDPDLEYLSDGLSENLIDRLSELPQLKVIARNSSFKYRDENPDLQAIARHLGVQAIITGRIVRRGDDLSVRVEVVDTRDNKQIWGEQYKRKLSDAPTIATEIATSVSQKMRLKLSGSQEENLARRGTNNPQALDYVLRGDFLSRKESTRMNALENYIEAVALDPNYALAQARLAHTYQSLAASGRLDPKDVLPKVKAAALRAIELDPALADSHFVLAELARDRWDWPTAEREYKITLDLNPSFIRANSRYCNFLSVVGRHEEAVAEANKIRELDPQNVISLIMLPRSLLMARRLDESIAELKKVIDLDPIYGSYVCLGSAYAAKGMYAEAIAAFTKAIELGGNQSYLQICLGAAYARAGERREALAILQDLESGKDYVAPGELAILYEALGERDKAIATLEQAYLIHDLQLQYLNVERGFDSMRGDSRFQDLLRRIGL